MADGKHLQGTATSARGNSVAAPKRPGTFRTFQTRQIDDAAGFIRTFGTVVEKHAAPLSFSESEAMQYAHPAPPPNCARGKVVAFSGGDDSCEAVCYQLSDCRSRGKVVACCNATAAAAAYYTQTNGSGRVTMRLELPSPGHACVEARVERDRGAALATVHQTWSGLAFSVAAETRVDGRRCAVCISPLNNYLVIQTRPNEAAAGFQLDEAIALWRHFGLAREPLLSRIAVVQSSNTSAPSAKFFTCEREHPSAPLTGLAVLAIAAAPLDWLGLKDVAGIKTPAGNMPLPRASVASDTTATVEIPEVIVTFDLDSSSHASGAGRA